jgi:hypothetical protein
VLATLRESADIVTYDHKDINNDGKVDAADATARPTLTVAVLGASSSTVAMTANALDRRPPPIRSRTSRSSVIDAATSGRFNDVVDLSALSGATVSYAIRKPWRSVGGGNAADDDGTARCQYAR